MPSSPIWGLKQALLLLHKQRNRGQDGAGLLCYKGDVPHGQPYFHRIRKIAPTPPWRFLSQEIWEAWEKWQAEGQPPDAFPFAGTGYLAHLRYGTFGGYTLEETHPVIRQSSWPARSLAIAGNFNLTNADELFERLVALGQHPLYASDTYTILERMGHFLDEYVEALYHEAKAEGYSKPEATTYIKERFPLLAWLGRAARRWDGGYVIAGFLGTGWGFVMRDPWGIRPVYYLATDTCLAAASEAAALHNVFEVMPSAVQELPPGHALAVSPNGAWEVAPFTEPAAKPTRCVFERIYFSRGNSPHIYSERQRLGGLLAPAILRRVDPSQVIFTYVPNTSETAFLGLIRELRELVPDQPIRAEKLIWKDTEGRTFIASPDLRETLSRHTYDVVMGLVSPTDTVVCLDDSIVRGTTLRRTLLPTLGRLQPARIVFVSAAPQIRYPDFYGIDMASLGELVAFQAAIALLRETGQTALLDQTYALCKAAEGTEAFTTTNFVRALYAPFTEEQIAAKIAELVRPPQLSCPLEILFQPVEHLPKAFSRHEGTWYFTGHYPTPGGYRQVNRTFLAYYEARAQRRAYEISPL